MFTDVEGTTTNGDEILMLLPFALRIELVYSLSCEKFCNSYVSVLIIFDDWFAAKAASC